MDLDEIIKFKLSFTGKNADNHQIDLYDVSHALIGFQRTIALTTHLVLNGTIITQAPSLKGAKIYTMPSQKGSWEIIGIVSLAATAAYKLLTLPKDSPLGHLVHSAYDFMIKKSLGFNVNYDQSLFESYESHHRELPVIRESQIDSLAEKCHTALTDMHRPIYANKTASQAKLLTNFNHKEYKLIATLSDESYYDLITDNLDTESRWICGRVSSYNTNTFKGRIYDFDEHRPIPFELKENAQAQNSLSMIIESLSCSAIERNKGINNTSEDSNTTDEAIYFLVKANRTINGVIRSYIVYDVSGEKPDLAFL